MEAITDIIGSKKEIDGIIRRYGFQPEHNLYHYMYGHNSYRKNVFFRSGGYGIMASVTRRGIWRLLAEPLAPEKARLQLIEEFIRYSLRKGKKAFLELGTENTKAVRELARTKRFRATGSYEVLYWPVYNLKKHDPSLPGQEWKKMRNILNCLTKKHKIEVIPSKEVQKDKLRRIIHEWRKARNANDQVNNSYYLKIIEDGFMGFDMTRTVIIDGVPCTITGGWRIPNSNGYYSCLGIMNYAHQGLGEFSNLDDLAAIKKKGFDFTDFGGSDRVLLSFKKKFRPESIYKTYIFSVVPSK